MDITSLRVYSSRELTLKRQVSPVHGNCCSRMQPHSKIGKGAMAEVSTIISVVEQHLHVLTEESQQKTDITK
ncbi:hypothetical protein FQA47_005889 [Oryzias melastigma]|uniref:Uncharacterized protein n=1 Tax=Oryzias melastigma TaxID=30732 RepID=A0A834FR46_ORYME|nr:hypothetical protein FQA47_005889 [Oryzias melastigma]